MQLVKLDKGCFARGNLCFDQNLMVYVIEGDEKVKNYQTLGQFSCSFN